MALQGSPLPLMLLAALLLLLGASANQEQYERFLRQHFDPNPSGRDDAYCDRRMRRMMNEDRRMDRDRPRVCKDRNTFVHGNSDDIKAICTSKGGKNYENEFGQPMRQSIRTFQVTNCKDRAGKQKGRDPDNHNNHRVTPTYRCKYRASSSSRIIVIACDEDGLPVHLDETQI